MALEEHSAFSAAGRRRLKRLRWLAVFGPIVFVALLEYGVQTFYPEFLAWPGRFVMAGIVIIGLVFFYGALFATIEEMQRSLTRQNRELLALHNASLDIYGELSLSVILQKVVDQTRVLLEARYGAVSVIRDGGGIEQFVTSGIDSQTQESIGSPPVGRGLLGVPLHEGESIRLPDIDQHPRAAGFPENHPPMKSLLAVPINCKGSFKGNLYLADKLDGEEFTLEDEATLTRFANQVSIAIDNADLHRQLRSLAIAEERARIAREMHDGMAQILAYVNTKAQAVREHLRQGHSGRAAEQLEQLAVAAREVYGEVREGILALRTIPDTEESLDAVLRRFVDSWKTQSDIEVDILADEELGLEGTAELQLLRIIQESLSNIRKHANAQRARVELRARNGSVVAVISDDGTGFDRAQLSRTGAPRFGLNIMRERAESVGGTLAIDSEPGAGTRITASVPIVTGKETT